MSHQIKLVVGDGDHVWPDLPVLIDLTEGLKSELNLLPEHLLLDHVFGHEDLDQIEDPNENSPRDEPPLSVLHAASNINHPSCDGPGKDLVQMGILSCSIEESALPEAKEPHPGREVAPRNGSPPLGEHEASPEPLPGWTGVGPLHEVPDRAKDQSEAETRANVVDDSIGTYLALPCGSCHNYDFY